MSELSEFALVLFAFVAGGLITAACFALLNRKRRPHSDSDEPEMKFRELVEVAPAGLWRTDQSGRFICVNQALKELSGFSSADDFNQPWIKFIHADDREQVATCWSTAVAQRLPFSTELRWLHPDGSARWLVSMGQPEFAADGQFTGYAGCNIDIGRLKQMEEDLKIARDTAEREASSKSTFLAHMSHDIRTPMNGVIGFTQLLLESDLDEDQRSQVELIADSGRALMQLLNDILDHAKIESGELTIVSEPTDLRQRLSHCANLIEPLARAKGLSIGVWVDETVPEFLQLDQLRIGQILLNLVGNAVKFTETGGIDVEARMENSTDGRSLLLSVMDTGIGIEESRLEEIFTPFVQEDNSTARRFGGTGLGLAISSQLVSMMGGRISVHSKRGVGTQFTVRLPIVPVTVSAPPKAELADISDADALSCLKGAHVLIAEDHGINQELVMSMAQTLQLDAQLVENGAEAVQAVINADKAGVPFDAILMDLQMPEVDGLEATCRLRALGYDAETLPIIALTANCYPDDIANCAEAGMQSHLGKPVTTVTLARELARWLAPGGKAEFSHVSKDEDTGDPEEISAAALSSINGLQDRYRNRKNEIVTNLRQSIETPPDQTDWEELGRQLHKLAGVAANFGEPELGEASRRLERWLNTSHEPEELLQALKREWPVFEKAA
ncbi:PAS domain-containing hybrid sensor histidine kinase/response regulator [Erythrobacter alti]|uniref:PAS domain-containing hybrid sensor histidine kinase/response regulator n=1 Tax=Erythrobacter alti TaxID=1896145 RepID=UPI0030F45C09